MKHRYKLPEDDQGENLCDLGLNKDFMDSTSKGIIYKSNKLSSIKIKNLCPLKYTI